MLEWEKIEGLSDYQNIIDYMENHVNMIASNQAEEKVILTEHNHVITSGTSHSQEELKFNTEIPIVKTGRGGKFTYHGPGQRVVYPIFDLKKQIWDKDLKKYLNFLHLWIISTLEELGIEAHTRDDYIGVWTKIKNKDYKIAAIGIRARKWIVFHGFAINIFPDLKMFDSFVPCGISDLGVTSVKELGVDISFEKFDEILKKQYYKQNIIK